MSKQSVHIVSFDVPYPANYGGVIDVFYKVKALSEHGFSVILHCFDYGKGAQSVLEGLCSKVYNYKRSLSKKQLLSKLPFIVASRKNPELLENLKKDNATIIFEGLHTCYFLNHPDLSKRKRLVRMHNVEHDYYKGLAQAESNAFKQLYFKSEAKKLKKFEAILEYADEILAISDGDQSYFQKKFGKSVLLPSFPPFTKVECKTGLGDFALYHGNLEVAENKKAVMYLLEEVFSEIQYPLVIAGSKPSKEMRLRIEKMPWVTLKEDLEDEAFFDLIASAQMLVLPTFQATGVKLKLLNSLFLGRHCLVNSPMVQGTGLESLCQICDDPSDFIENIQKFRELPFTDDEISKRVALLESEYSSQASLARLLPLLS